MTRKHLDLVASFGLVAFLCAPSRASAQTSPSLGNANTYSVLAGSPVTNTGATGIDGNAGISPGTGATPHYTGLDVALRRRALACTRGRQACGCY
jgi:hypothetical protein